MILYLKLVVILALTSMTSADYTNPAHPEPSQVRFYPKNSIFLKADLIDHGCSVFIKQCPSAYKVHTVCARHYDGHYKSFTNYCELEYENCNGWRQWSMIKQSRC